MPEQKSNNKKLKSYYECPTQCNSIAIIVDIKSNFVNKLPIHYTETTVEFTFCLSNKES